MEHPELTITAEYIQRHTVFVAESEGCVVGMISIEDGEPWALALRRIATGRLPGGRLEDAADGTEESAS